MTEQERKEAFLREFKDLEQYLLSLLKETEGHSSFSKALNDVYYKRLNPVISQWENYDFLRTAADLRNILSHENDVCAPSEIFLDKFEKLSSSILSPLTCYQACTKDLLFASYRDSLYDLMEEMEKRKLSHVPILNANGAVEGVFSTSTLFDYVLENGPLDHLEELTMADFASVTGLESHTHEAFLFVPRRRSVRELYPYLVKQKAHDKPIALFFVTEHGKKEEKVLGVLTSIDLALLKA